MLTDTQVVVRLFVAALLGGVIGFERQKHNKRIAGLRTHILVSVGSCLIMLVSIYMFEGYGSKVGVDPGRIAAGVVTGIGFLGAGTIIRSGESVKGLTTAASLWTVSGIGLAAGCGFYIASYAATVIALATLYLLLRIQIEDNK